ncbi:MULTISPECIES: DUF3006 domain-containing protein [Paenibacillus]|uniref:DUF3006 domain-containing protein n=1 Tax=Paenibacillus TaxID=44249 RepID=UPI002FE2A6E2
MTGIVEGFEEGDCLLEIDGKVAAVPRELMDPDVRAGDVVLWNGERWRTDRNLTEERTRKIRELMNEVWED